MISGGMTFTVDSDLNEASPQFTLTCMSTGGPATTVTWTRDSVTVTEGTETVFNHTTSQYTHTLTVTERLGGLYTCTVGNNKPSHNMTPLTVQGVWYVVYLVDQYCVLYIISPVAGTPTGLEAHAENTKVVVSWSLPSDGDSVAGYLVYYHHPRRNSTVRNISSHDNSDTFEEVNSSDYVYRVSVQALSEHLPSELTEQVTVRGVCVCEIYMYRLYTDIVIQSPALFEV